MKTLAFCQACGWAHHFDGTPTAEEVMVVMNKGCKDCGGFLFIRGQIKREGEE